MEATAQFLQDEKENFVTVVSVGSESSQSLTKCDSFSSLDSKSSAYVTVLTIGDSEEDCPSKDTIEEVLVYRLPGERLGFGLKFEGGTKANEFVKRLFIQSCAPDSPASRVQCSWGTLTESDEVLEIDCMPVNTMTRIDCVRCLKDSNVVIKLLVKHFSTECKQSSDLKNKSLEDLPQVISAEKKRTPPPPPPVPPRKIPKKFYKNNHENNPVPAARQINSDVTNNNNNNNNKKKFQSPRSSGRASYSPDIPRRDRRFSDGSLGPPDAEVYVDLFSQESTQSLSESDDTGSSISTVVDRFGSFPTTTTSSLAGSLPSTPTSVQKQIDFTNLFNLCEEEDFSTSPLNKNLIKQTINTNKCLDVNEKDKIEEKSFISSISEEGTPLQPPSCFQDAPLSYGNEDMRINETKSNEIDVCELSTMQDKKPMNNKYIENNEKNPIKNSTVEDKVFKKPPVPPRSRDLINAYKTNGCKEFQNIHDENMNISNLPRLVDFVPKSTTRDNFENPVEIINIFLENERRDNVYLKNEYYGDDEIDAHLEDVYNNDIDVYSSKWSLSSQLATIGEVEEEGSQDSNMNRSPLGSTPIVIVENADTEEIDPTNIEINETNSDEGINGKMETLSSDSRQPPDGHEFPDYVEVTSEQIDDKFVRENYQELLSQQLTEKNIKPTLVTNHKSTESVNWSQNRSSFNDFSNVPMQNMSSLSKLNSVSNSDLSSINLRDTFDSGDEILLRRNSLDPTLHSRSQSLIDMSTISKQKNDRWTILAEQRRKGYSKLKGLVIPEHVSENEPTPAVNIPEIISHTTPSFVLETKIHANETMQCHSNETEPVTVPITSPPWTASNTSTFPKYSPAFKRKSLQVYSQPKSYKPEEPQTAINKSPVKSVPNEKSATLKNKQDDELRLDLSDSPKSLESITSPTRSDCSFDYVTNSFIKVKYNSKQEPNRTLSYASKLHKDIGKSEDESDNDSAVSSSQSSYISRCSPPPSPTRSCEMLDYDSNVRTKQDVDKYGNIQCRLLKAASVEAINRKNILASAKCRSGRDLKVGSPVIQRKYEDDDSPVKTDPGVTDNTVNQSEPPIRQENCQPVECHRTLLKEKRSISCEESISKPVINGDSGVVKVKTEVSQSLVLTSKISEKNNLISLKPVAGSLTNFSVNLRSTKLPPKNNAVSPRSISKNNKSMSVTDLRKSFEKFGTTPPLMPQNTPTVVPTKESKTKNIKTETKPNKIESLPDKKIKSNGEIVNLEKVKPPTIPKETISEQKVEINSAEPNRRKIVLCPEFVGGSIGITLAGGTDYETKEITVHKIRFGSVAYNDGQLKKGDKIVSINDKDTSNLTHAESVELLKEPVSKFVLIVEDGKEEAVSSPQRKSFSSEIPPSPIRKSFSSEFSEPKSPEPALSEKSVTHVITLPKNGAGLGFSIEGGKDSLEGDLPLRVKKIFQGGVAEKNGMLCVGDELLAINDISLTNLSRIETWSLMKKLPDGDVSIHIHR